MQFVVLSHEQSWYRHDLVRAAEVCGYSLSWAPFSALRSAVVRSTNRATESGSRNANDPTAGQSPVDIHSHGVVLSEADACIVRTMPPGTLEQVVFRMDCLHALESQGTRIWNPPRSLECAVDKSLTTQRLAAAGLPTPRTIVCEDSETAMAAFQELGGDVVVKPVFGAEGRGILRISDPDLAFRSFRTLERLGCVLYLQEFITHAGNDLRVMVLDGKVLAAMRRSNPTDFRTNVSRSATATACTATETEMAWAIQAAAVTGTRLAGVDILYDLDGNGYVIEVNGVPGWKALRTATGCDVAVQLLTAIADEVRSIRRGTPPESTAGNSNGTAIGNAHRHVNSGLNINANRTHST